MKRFSSLALFLPVMAAAQSGSTAIATRVSAILGAGVTGGVQGLYLKQVGGSVLANLQERTAFDPGTAATIVPLLYLIRQVQTNTITLDTPVIHFDNPPAGCPNPNYPLGTEPLRVALREMMWHSDTARAHAIESTLGRSNLDAFARSIGMANTNMPLIPGCATSTPGRLTLTDAARLYEGVLDGSLLQSPQTAFLGFLAGKAQMAVEGSDWDHIWYTDIPNMIRQEAPAGITASQMSTYQTQMDLGYKSGATVVCQNADCTRVQENYSVSGWARVPYCAGKDMIFEDSVFGVFLANAPDDSWFAGKKTAASIAFAAAKGELLREQIHGGLASCYAADPVIVTPIPGSTLTGPTVRFAWSTGANWDGYRLEIGRSPGGNEYASIVTSSPGAIAANLPCDSRPLYVRLWAHGGAGYADPSDYTYAACANAGPQITSPPPGSNLASASVTFTWTAVSGADSYRLDIGTDLQRNDLGSFTVTGRSATVNSIPADGRTIFVRIAAHTAAGFLTPNDYTYNNLLGQTPAITSVVNAASLLPGLSPVCLAIANGSNFTAGATVAVGNTRAFVVGAPSAGQIVFLIPANAGVGTTSVTVTSGGVASAPFPVTLSTVSPGLYATILDAAGATISTTHPAQPDDPVSLRAVGMGPVDANGRPTLPFRVLVGANNLSASVDSIAPVANAPGVTQIDFRVPAGMAGGAQPVTVAIGAASSNAVQLVVAGPAISGILNAASFAPGGKIAPGSIVSLFGNGLADDDRFGIFPSVSLPGGGSIAFNGIAAPLFDVAASAGQINLLVPFELPTDGNASVVLANSSGTSAAFPVAMAPAAPGIFRIGDPSNSRRANAAALIANTAWRVIPSSMAAALGIPQDCKANNLGAGVLCGQPAAPGDIIQIYCTGLGRATPNGNAGAPPLRTGAVAPANGSVLYRTVETPQVTVGGADAAVVFSGIAPGFAGLYQVNIVVPAAAPQGDDVPLTIAIGGASDTATVAIRREP